MVKKASSLLFFLAVVISSCSLKKNSSESTDYIEQENLYQKTVKPYTFRLKPLDPARLMAINYGDVMGSFTKAKKDSIEQEYKNYICFVFEIDIAGFTGDIADYEVPGKEQDPAQKANYYLFGMQNSFTLKDEKNNSTACLIYYYERLNEIAKTNRFIIGFNNPGTNQLTVEYDNPYFNCGKINFSIDKQHLVFN